MSIASPSPFFRTLGPLAGVLGALVLCQSCQADPGERGESKTGAHDADGVLMTQLRALFENAPEGEGVVAPWAADFALAKIIDTGRAAPTQVFPLAFALANYLKLIDEANEARLRNDQVAIKVQTWLTDKRLQLAYPKPEKVFRASPRAAPAAFVQSLDDATGSFAMETQELVESPQRSEVRAAEDAPQTASVGHSAAFTDFASDYFRQCAEERRFGEFLVYESGALDVEATLQFLQSEAAAGRSDRTAFDAAAGALLLKRAASSEAWFIGLQIVRILQEGGTPDLSALADVLRAHGDSSLGKRLGAVRKEVELRLEANRQQQLTPTPDLREDEARYREHLAHLDSHRKPPRAHKGGQQAAAGTMPQVQTLFLEIGRRPDETTIDALFLEDLAPNPNIARLPETQIPLAHFKSGAAFTGSTCNMARSAWATWLKAKTPVTGSYLSRSEQFALRYLSLAYPATLNGPIDSARILALAALSPAGLLLEPRVRCRAKTAPMPVGVTERRVKLEPEDSEFERASVAWWSRRETATPWP